MHLSGDDLCPQLGVALPLAATWLVRERRIEADDEFSFA
jgi:hypothetical protein